MAAAIRSQTGLVVYHVMVMVLCLPLIIGVSGENYPKGVDNEDGGKRDVVPKLNYQEGEPNDVPLLQKRPEELEVKDMIEAVEESSIDLGFVHAFVASLSVIIVSELGDKTFFIAAIMAMRHLRLTVFSGAIGALSVMTILSALLGFATTIIPKVYTYYASTALFLIFGLRMLREGWYMSADEGQEEFEEVQADLKRRDEEMEKEAKLTYSQDPESGIIRGGKVKYRCYGLMSPIFLQAFTLTFLAEWGDRSQIATIVLAAREDVAGVMFGGILGHSLCTALAVIGGRIVAQKISARTVTLIGGFVFLMFGVMAIICNEDS